MSSDFIKFPDQPQKMREKIVESLAGNNFYEACEYAKRLYQVEKTFETNFLFANMLFEISEFDEAYQVTQDFKNIYLENLEFRSFYVEILINNLQFLPAQKLIEQTKNENLPLEILEQWNHLEEQCENLAMAMVEESPQEMKRKDIDDFLLEPPLSFTSQQKFITQLFSDNSKAFPDYAQSIFSHPGIMPLIKADVLEKLIQLKVDREYVYPWLDQEIKVNPIKHQLFTDMKVMKDLEFEVNQLVGANEQMKDLLIAEYTFQCLMLYPITDDIIEDSQLWLVILYQRLMGNAAEDLESFSKPAEEIIELMNKLDQLAWNSFK